MQRVSGFDVRVIESPRRKKTVSARFVGETIEIRVPQGLHAAERDRYVHELSEKLRRKRSADKVDIAQRASELANRYDLPQPTSISWSPRQKSRWGSCTPRTGAIRLSDRLSDFPGWVLDYVIVHELAHLSEANHSPAFHRLVARFPRAERAEGFLLAVSLGHGGTLGGFASGENCDTEIDG